MSYTHVKAGGAGQSLATSSSATTMMLRPFSGCGITRQVWVGCGNVGLVLSCDIKLRLRHVGDIENEEAVMPVADIEPVAVTRADDGSAAPRQSSQGYSSPPASH